jgi:DNA-binding winged helix-turn-helix (wHTH) protein/tetratricopeptide (TPR) repeat protein
MARSPARDTPALKARFGEFELDEADARLFRSGQPVSLAPTPFGLLCALVRRPDVLLTKNALLDEVWGHQFVTDSVLKTAISDLRTVLGDDPRQPRFIETVPRRGYRFIAPVQKGGADAPAKDAEERSAPPLPVRAAAPVGFIGRNDALARLASFWTRVRDGERAVVWIAGEAGIGKSTLIERFISLVEGGTHARGQCVDLYGAGEPYLPVLEAIAELCRGDADASALLRAVAPSWLLQLPWLSTADERESLGREVAGAGPERMLREMGEFLDRYAARTPLLLVTEDLHWSDRATVQLIDYFARRRAGGRVMWLASFRLAEVVARDHPLRLLRQELRLHGRCEELVLDSFSEREVAHYVAEHAPALAADEDFVRALHQRTDGVPLFVASLASEAITQARSGVDRAASPPPRAEAFARAAPAFAVPENLTGLIDQYISRLDDDDRALLSAAAVCGTEFRSVVVAHALERDLAWVEDRCESLARMQLWLAAPAGAPGGAPYAFRHELFRQVLYERTGASLRLRLHRQVGRALETERAAGRPVSAAELAMHFARCRESLLALRYCAEAAESALRHLSPFECKELAAQGLALVGQATDGAERTALEFELAMLHSLSSFHVLGVGDETQVSSKRAYALLDQLPRHPLRGTLVHHHGFVHCLRADYEEAVRVADSAGRSAADDDAVMQVAAATLHGQLGLLLGRPRRALERIERAIPALERTGSAPDQGFMQVTLLCMMSIHLLHLGRLAQARTHLAQAYECAERLRYPTMRMVVLWMHALMAVRLDDAAQVAALADQIRALVEESDLGQARGAWRWFRGWARARQGEPRDGLALILEGYEYNAGLGMVSGGSETLGYAAEARLLAGDADGAQRELAAALRIVTAHGERVYLPQLLLLQGAIAAAQGNAAVAGSSMRAALDEAREQEAPFLELRVLVHLIEHGSARPDDLAALRTCVDALEEANDTLVVARARALLKAGQRSR